VRSITILPTEIKSGWCPVASFVVVGILSYEVFEVMGIGS